MRVSIQGIVALVLMTLYASAAVRAADPQPYRVAMAPAASMEAALRASSQLFSLRDSAPVGPFGLIARARGDIDRLKTVLESNGYYQSAVDIKIEGLGLNSPGLGDALSALPKGRDARVEIGFELGPLYHLRQVGIAGMLPASAAGGFTLKTGDPAVAADVLAAGARVLTLLQDQGYAFAKVDPPVAYEDQTLPVLDLTFRVDSGERVNFGEIVLQGLKRVHEKLVRRRLTIRTGQQYSPLAIEAARRDLLALGPFNAVTAQVGTAVDATGGVPITFVLRERARHAVAVNGAYSTDLGGSGGVTWSDRNVFGNAEQLNIAASVLNLGGSDATGIGYDTSAKFLVPDVGRRDQSLQVAIGAIKQSLQAYDQKAVTSGVTLNRKLSGVWSASAGITTADEQILQVGNRYHYTLVALPLAVVYDSTHLASPLEDPTHGLRGSLSVTPTRSLGDPSAFFIISQIKGAAYLDLHQFGFTDPGRSVLAVRGLAGVAQGAGEYSLPPDQRFYGGGSGTIRGYSYQFVGPLVQYQGNQIPIGGTAIVAGSLEFRQRFGANLGGAVFVDGGQVSAALKPSTGDFRVGAGAGVRYYTPIGPVRLDVAVPTRRDADGASFQVYVGLGQAF